MPRNVYMHDWFVTDRHLIFVLHPVEMDYWPVFLGRKSMAESLKWRPEKGNLVMVLEREGERPPLFAQAPACYLWHSLNAYRQGSEIVADFVGYDNPDHFVGRDPLVSAVMAGRRGEHAYPGVLRRYLIGTATGALRGETVDAGSYEWPRVNELHRCHRYRFGYLARARSGDFFWTMVSRVDLKGGGRDSWDFGPRRFTGEPVFVPLPGRSYRPDGADEPGYLLAEVYDSGTRRSFLAVLRAEALSAGPVALVHLNHHVPFSYHGWWCGRA